MASSYGPDPQAELQAKGNSLHIWEGGRAILKNKALLPGVGPTNRNISPTPGSRPGAWTPNERISISIVYILSNLENTTPLPLYDLVTLVPHYVGQAQALESGPQPRVRSQA